MSDRHYCSQCHRPKDGLTSREVFTTLSRGVPAHALVFRAPGLRRLADRIGACDCAEQVTSDESWDLDAGRRSWRSRLWLLLAMPEPEVAR